MPIKKLPFYLNPRSKAILKGVDKLSDIELLAIFLKSGTKKNDALIIAKTLFEKHKNFININKVSFNRLQEVPGIGTIKALEILSIFELTRRINKDISNFKYIKNDKEAAKFAFAIMNRTNNESFLLLLLDEYKKIIYYEELFKGSNSQLVIEPKTIIKLVIINDAFYFYCVHNHPSGNVKPSRADILTTRKIISYAEIFNINFLKHIIINSQGDFSIVKA